jgi:hypothetical protein
MSGVPAQSHLGTLQRLLFALVEHRFVICLFKMVRVPPPVSALQLQPQGVPSVRA